MFCRILISYYHLWLFSVLPKAKLLPWQHKKNIQFYSRPEKLKSFQFYTVLISEYLRMKTADTEHSCSHSTFLYPSGHRQATWAVHSSDSGSDLVAKSYPTLVAPWTVACQTPLSLGIPRQEYWSGWPFLSPGDLPDPGIKPTPSALAGGFLPLSHQGSPMLP